MIFLNKNKKNKKNRIVFTGRFAAAAAILYSLFIIVQAFIFCYTIETNSKAVKNTVLDSGNEMLLLKAGLVTEQIRRQKPKSPDKAIAAIKRAAAADDDILYAVIFSRTDDDNYFMAAAGAPVNSALTIAIDKKNPVRELSSSVLKESRSAPRIDPKVYSKDGYSWQNVYVPALINGKRFVIQYMFRTSMALRITDSFNSVTKHSSNIMIIASISLVIGIILLTFIFWHSHSLLVKKLSLYMQRAAKGELDLNVNANGDAGLDELASSFNNLVEVMKSTGKERDNEILKELFAKGAALLKENRPAESLPLFEIVLLLNPESFGAYFNSGVAMAKTGDYDGSIAMFGKARAINPEYELTEKYISRVERMMEKNAGKQ
jgi:tetratricopeptide (TPR) repeat protein